LGSADRYARLDVIDDFPHQCLVLALDEVMDQQVSRGYSF